MNINNNSGFEQNSIRPYGYFVVEFSKNSF